MDKSLNPQKESSFHQQMDILNQNDFEPLPLLQGIRSCQGDHFNEINQSPSNHQNTNLSGLQSAYHQPSIQPQEESSYHEQSIVQPQEQTTINSIIPLQYQEGNGRLKRTANNQNDSNKTSEVNLKAEQRSTMRKKVKVHKLEMPSRDELKSYWEQGHVPDKNGMLPLHKACALFPQNSKLIGMIIRGNPNAVNTPVRQPNKGGEEGPDYINYVFKKELQGSTNSIMYPKYGSYPIHIAITNNASSTIIKLLVRAAPGVLSKRDGAGLVPLSLALRCEWALSKDHNFYDLVNLLLSANQVSATIPDKRMQTPLHYACMSIGSGAFYGLKDSSCSQDRSSHLNVLKLLVEANSDAIHQQNFNGLTPLELAQHGDKCNDDCIAYLQKVGYNEEVFEEIDVPNL